MQKTLRPPLLIAALLAVLTASPVFARSSGSDEAQIAPNTETAEPLTTGSVSSPFGPQESRKKKLEDCMAIWEPATHMSKREWQRTCNSQLDEELNP
jgi:hypothetical protein